MQILQRMLACGNEWGKIQEEVLNKNHLDAAKRTTAAMPMEQRSVVSTLYTQVCFHDLDPIESRHHLFFKCHFSAEVWEKLTRTVRGDRYTTDWPNIIYLISETNGDKMTSFTIIYVFQATVHSIWRERNQRRHKEVHSTPVQLVEFIDKGVRNRFSSIVMTGDMQYEGGLRYWFTTRIE
ncbi:hypothetical protein N665_1798s0001 [Sinapis alba]|nr:hypothetical protein N665_1798s0001 [Sinapis alba]